MLQRSLLGIVKTSLLSENTPCGPEPVCRDKDIVSTLTYTQERPSAALLRGPVSSTTSLHPPPPGFVYLKAHIHGIGQREPLVQRIT